MRIDLEPIDPPVVFLPPDAVALRIVTQGTPLLGTLPNIYAGPEGELRYASLDERGIRYEVFLAGAERAAAAAAADRGTRPLPGFAPESHGADRRACPRVGR